MINKKMKKAITKNLTPRGAWDIYVGMSEEIFISNFYAETKPITDIREMCKVYSREIPMIFESDRILFTDNQIEDIEMLLTIHLSKYIDSKGGIDKLNLFTVEELDSMVDEIFEEIIEALAHRYNTTKEIIYESIRIQDRNILRV